MNEKQEQLAEYFRNLPDPVPIAPAAESFEEEIVPEVKPANQTTPATAGSVVEMLEKIKARQIAGIEESPNAETAFESLGPVVPISYASPKPPITDEIIEKAFRAAEKALNREEMEQEESDIMEAIIIPYKRPVLDVLDDDFSAPPPDWDFLNNFRSQIKTLLPSIGRIDVPDLTMVPYAGTGFFVGKGILMTNRHVALYFTEGVGTGSKYVTLKSGLETFFDSKYEVGSTGTGEGPKRYRIKKVLLIHPHWDMALLEVEGIDGEVPSGLALANSPPAGFPGSTMTNVIVVGYPMIDIRGNIPEQIDIFRNIFGRKRLLPGFLKDFDDVQTKWQRTLHAATHDASTLGGNSGSAIIDLMTGKVLALHFGGRYLKANYGVPMWEIAQDPKVNEAASLNFSGMPGIAAASAPVWLDAWTTVKPFSNEESTGTLETGDSTKPTEGSGTAATSGVPVNGNQGSVSETPLLPVSPDWFEQVTDAQLVEAMRRDTARTERLIRETLLKNEAEDLIGDLRQSIATGDATPEEGVFDFLLGTGKTDPSLPEIIYLHGIMGGHLATHEGIGGRIWLSPLAFIAGGVAQKLALTMDGERDLTPNQTLFPDGHIRFVYEKSARKWRMSGFVVHEFSFDWRKPLVNSADRLHLFIESLRLERPHKKFALVCHSMGGLVAALYAARHPEWSGAVTQAIFMGSPLRGSFVPVEAFLGTYPLYAKFDLVDLRADLQDYVSMSTTLPGLIDMLPDPEVFSDAAPLYERPTWLSEIAPSQAWLEQSRRVKRLIATSPLLDGANLIVSPDHPTINNIRIVDGRLSPGKADKRGDGTVPLRSAAGFGIPNVKVYRAGYGHGELPREPAVIVAVAELLKNGRCDLPPLDESIITDLNPLPVTESILGHEEGLYKIEESIVQTDLAVRMRRGIFTQRDADFMLRRNYDAL